MSDQPTSDREPEFHFERTDEASGTLTYRCLEFNIDFCDSETSSANLMQEIVDCLNEHFDHKDEDDDED